MCQRRRLPALALALASLALAVAGSGAGAQQETTESPKPTLAGQAKVTYVSGTTVYLDAGLDDGIAVGDLVEVVRDDAVVARLKVTYATAKRASCSPEGEAPPLAVGDAVRFTKHAPPTADSSGAAAAAGATAAAAPSKSRSGESALRKAGVRGRIGATYLAVRDRSGYGQDFRQPSLSLMLVGTQVGGAPVDFAIDARPRRTYVTTQSGTDTNRSSNRIYQANVAWTPGSFRLAFGRQMSPSLAALSLFDGMLAEYRNPRIAAGLFGGTQPDPVSYGYSSDVKQYGAFVEGGSAPAAPVRWWLNLGASSSTENGEINRDFVWLQGRLGWKGLTGYLQQQVDVNRGWRKTFEGSSTTNSGTFLALRYNLASTWSVDGGYDSRRNVPLYRDYVTPVTQFDDATRQGYWAGAEWRPKNRFVVGANGRWSRGGSAGDSSAYTLNLGAINMTRQAVDVRLRGTSYTGPAIEGWLATASVGLDIVPTVHLDAHGGTRQDKDVLGFGDTQDVRWYGLNLDIVAAAHVLAIISYDHTTGEFEANDQLFATVSWRF